MLNTKLKEFNLVNEALKLNKKLFNVLITKDWFSLLSVFSSNNRISYLKLLENYIKSGEKIDSE